MPRRGLPAAVDPQGDAAEGVQGDGGEEEGFFERRGLVVGPGEEEVGVGGVEGAGEEGDQGGVG